MTCHAKNTIPARKEPKKRILKNPFSVLLNGFIFSYQASQKNPHNYLNPFRSFVRFGKVMAAISIALLIFTSEVRAEIPMDLAIRAIVGEAANQGETGMIAVAEAIRNRGHLRGVYGLKRDLTKEPAWVFQRAEKAWQLSAGTNLVNGADHWENVKAFGKPKWADSMIITATIGDHVFYKENRK